MESGLTVPYGKSSDGGVTGVLRPAANQEISATRFCYRTVHGTVSAGRSLPNIQYPSRRRSYRIQAAARSEKKEIFAIQYFLLIFMQPIAT